MRPVPDRGSLTMDTPQLLRAMTDAYVARRRKGGAFDDTAAIQAFWECQPQMSTAQTEAFADTGKGNSVAGWKIVLRGRLTADEPRRRRPVAASRW
jgi:hypothetical protein